MKKARNYAKIGNGTDQDIVVKEREEIFQDIRSIIRPLSKLMVRRFSGLFWPLFDPNCRGNIRKLILPLQFGSKIGSKEPEKRQNINFERGLLLIPSQ
jgi:hypothetical protein